MLAFDLKPEMFTPYWRQVPTVSGEDFASIVSSTTRPVLVLFTASWAPPCRAQAEEVRSLARECGERFLILAVEGDREEELTALMGVRVLPTTLVMRHGAVLTHLRGFQTAIRLKSALIAAEAPKH
jgi:thioredoxin-like negative regulator of GroEL